MKAFCVVASSFCVASCALFGTSPKFEDNHFEDAHVGYDVGKPSEAWTQVKLGDVNVAWHHAGIGAALLVNSHCEGVSDAPLEGLAGELLMGTTEREIHEQTVMPHSRREGLETIATAKLDGVKRKRALFVLKKDGCVYDVVYDAPPERFEEGLVDYRRVRDGLDVGPRRDRS